MLVMTIGSQLTKHNAVYPGPFIASTCQIHLQKQLLCHHNHMAQVHEVLDLCLSHLNIAGLARAALLDRHYRSLVNTTIRQSKGSLIVDAVKASTERSYEHKHKAVSWLAKLFSRHELQPLAEKLTAVSNVPKECCTVLVKRGLRISQAHMVAAARAGVRGVHAWACAQQELRIKTDVTEAAWKLLKNCSEGRITPWFENEQPFANLQPAQLEELLFLAVSTHESAALGLLQLVRDPERDSVHMMPPWMLSAAQRQPFQAAVLRMPQETLHRLLHSAVQRGYGRVLAWYESWPALPQPQQEAVAAVMRQAARQGEWDTVVDLLRCRTVQQLTAELVTEVIDTAVQQEQHHAVAKLAWCFNAAGVQPSIVCAWLLAELTSGCLAVPALSRMHAAMQINSEAAAGLLDAALQAVQQHNSCAAQAIVELPAVQQHLDAATAATFCMVAVEQGDKDAAMRVCRLSIAQEFSAATVYELVEAATQHDYSAESMLQLLVGLPGAQRIPPEQLAACVVTVLQAEHRGPVRTGPSVANVLLSFPTAWQMQAAQAGTVIKAALAASCLGRLKVPFTLDAKAPKVALDLFQTAFQQRRSAKNVQWLLDNVSISQSSNQQLFIKVLQAAVHLQHVSGLQLLCEQPAAARLSLAAVLGVLQHEMLQQLEQQEQQRKPACKKQQQQQQHALARLAGVLVRLCNSLPQGGQHWRQAAVCSMLELAVRLDSLPVLKQLVKLRAARDLDDASHEQLVEAAKEHNAQGAVLDFVEKSWQ